MAQSDRASPRVWNGFNVWVYPINEPCAGEQRKLNRTFWSVPRNARPGDLVLYYKTAPQYYLDDAWKLTSNLEPARAAYKRGTGYFADIRRICRFDAPVHLSQLQEHPVLKTAGFVRGNVRGGYKVTSDWPQM